MDGNMRTVCILVESHGLGPASILLPLFFTLGSVLFGVFWWSRVFDGLQKLISLGHGRILQQYTAVVQLYTQIWGSRTRGRKLTCKGN